MTAEITLILGGVRSGKSAYAEKLAGDWGANVLYIATAEAGDAEMSARIEAHQRARPATWQTLEAPLEVGAALAGWPAAPAALLLDCLTLLVSNLVLKLEQEPQAAIEAAVLAEVDAILSARQRLAVPLVVVSNEVGLGVVPPYRLGRIYRDALGRANQRLAAKADRVLLMVAGLPLVVKDVSRGEGVDLTAAG